MPKKLPDYFLKERYEKDQKFAFIYDTFTPNYNKTIVTGKFYSKCERKTEEEYPTILENIKTAKDRGPKQKMKWPETSNQSYGWFDPLVEVDRNDYRLYFPQKSSEMIKHEIRLKQSKISKR